MGYEIVMCVMALFVNLLVVGCFALVYGTKMKYENGMLFGIHMPKEAQQDPEVKTLMEQYAVRMKKFYWWNVAGAVLSGLLALAILPSLCLDGCSGFLNLQSEVWGFSV